MVIRSVLVFIKVFFGIFPFLLCLQAEGRSIFNAMLVCYRFYKWHVFVPDTEGHFIRHSLRSKKIALCEYRIRQSVRDLVLAAKP